MYVDWIEKLCSYQQDVLIVALRFLFFFFSPSGQVDNKSNAGLLFCPLALGFKF